LNGDFPFFPNAKGAGQGGIRELWSWSLRSTFGTNKTNQATFGIQRSPVDFFINDDYSALGGFQLNTPGSLSNPTFTSTNLPQGRNTPVWEASDTFNWVRNSHNFSFGGDYRQVKASNYFYNAVIPRVTLGNNSANPDNLSTASFPGGISSTGLSNAQNVFDTVTGLLGSIVQGFNHTSPTSGFVAGKPRFFTPIQHNFAYFFTDSWRYRPDLTLQYGLRWEFQGVFDDRSGLVLQPDDRLGAIFGPAGVGNIFTPVGTPAVSDVTLTFAGGHNGKPIYKKDWNNFAPFLGFAWDPFKDGKTVIRSGFATHFTNDGFTAYAPAITANTGLFSSITNATPAGVFNSASVPTPATPVDAFPVSAKNNFGAGASATVSNSLTSFSPNLATPYVLEWNLAIQREVWKNLTIEARYVGNHAVKLYRQTDYNELNLTSNPFTGKAGTPSSGVAVANALTEFNHAVTNLAICTANRTACTGSAAGTLTFQNKGLPGQFALPIFDALFGANTSGVTSVAGSAAYQSATFQTNLTQGAIGSLYDTLRRSGTYFTTRTANFPLNFFVPMPWANGSILVDNSSWSNYNGFEFEVRRRFSTGLSFQGNYTLGKALTDQRFTTSQTEFQTYLTLANRALDKNRAGFDIRHSVAGNFLYTLPFGRGQHWGSNANGILEAILGGWNVQSIINWESGLPTTFSTGRLMSGQTSSNSNAVLRNMTAEQLQKQMGVFKIPGGVAFLNPASGLMTVTTKTGTNGLPSVTTAATMCTPGMTTPCFDFATPGQYGYGNLGFNAFNGPNFLGMDASVIKRINLSAIREKMNAEVRLEAFNALNHANFSSLQSTITSNQFGLATGLIDVSRGNGATSRNVAWAVRINF
jgi:hypothetical protein